MAAQSTHTTTPFDLAIRWRLGYAVILAGGVALGAALAMHPAAAPFLFGAIVLAALAGLKPMELVAFAQVLFLCLLLGTLIFGKQFSEIGFGPLFITEAGIGILGLTALLAGSGSDKWRVVLWLVPWFAAGLLALWIGASGSADSFWVARDGAMVIYAGVLVIVVGMFGTNRGAHLLLNLMAIGGVLSTVAWALGFAGYPEVAFNLYMALTYLAFATAWFAGVKLKPWMWLALAVQAFYFVSLGTRASWFAFAAAFAFLLLAPGRPHLDRVGRIALVVATAGVIFFGFVLPTLNKDSFVVRSASGIVPGSASAQSANSSWRLQFWSYYVHKIGERPWGYGLGPPSRFCDTLGGQCWDMRYSHDPTQRTGPHNSFLNIAYRFGLQGLFAFLFIVIALVRPAWRRLREGHDVLAIRYALAALIFASVSSFFSVSLEGPFQAVPFWALLGILYILGRSGRSERAFPDLEGAGHQLRTLLRGRALPVGDA
jgi:hypothetical protein